MADESSFNKGFGTGCGVLAAIGIGGAILVAIPLVCCGGVNLLGQNSSKIFQSVSQSAKKTATKPVKSPIDDGKP